MYLYVVMTTNTFIEAHCVSGTILSPLPVKLSTTYELGTIITLTFYWKGN